MVNKDYYYKISVGVYKPEKPGRSYKVSVTVWERNQKGWWFWKKISYKNIISLEYISSQPGYKSLEKEVIEITKHLPNIYSELIPWSVLISFHSK